ncbi:nitronate monooxygenase [Microbacterium sp. BWT-B31]|uniref:NAD(P)H-dependent flavin oxidoreductase n=1 Tax=Microbacterium sp. BWT-B31 TaxID=3232072 RepID=UPI0035286920
MNSLAAVLGIDAPIVLGPFGGLSSVALTAAVSDLGGLGSYGLYGYAPERIHDTITALRAATGRPFAVNLWLPTGDEVRPVSVALDAALTALAPVFDEVGVPVPAPPAAFLPDIDEQIEAVLDAAPAALSVVYGVPPAPLVDRARGRGIRIIGTATTVAEAVALDEAGVDAIVATGMEAAGHRVSFLAPAEASLVGTFALVPQIVDAVRAPVVAAGGIADRRGVAAAFALGASGVQVGTAFLRTAESAAPPSHRAAIAAASDTTTVLTRAMSGRLARGIPNRAMRALEADAILPFPAQNWLTGQFRAAAGRRDEGELLSLWAGQGAALARYDRAADVFAELAAGLSG